jgi:hypothetical protein
VPGVGSSGSGRRSRLSADRRVRTGTAGVRVSPRGWLASGPREMRKTLLARGGRGCRRLSRVWRASFSPRVGHPLGVAGESPGESLGARAPSDSATQAFDLQRLVRCQESHGARALTARGAAKTPLVTTYRPAQNVRCWVCGRTELTAVQSLTRHRRAGRRRHGRAHNSHRRYPRLP